MEKEDSKNIGDRIKALRKQRKLTQKELAALSRLAEITIRQYEAGLLPKEDGITRIAKALGVPRYAITKNRVDVFTGNAELATGYKDNTGETWDLQLFGADPGLSSSDKLALDRFRPLNAANKEKAIDYMDYLYDRQDPEDPAEPGAEE